LDSPKEDDTRKGKTLGDSIRSNRVTKKSKQQESESTKVKSTYVEDLLLSLKYKRFGVCPKCLPKKLSYVFKQILFDNTNSLFNRFDKEKELEGILNILKKFVRRFRSYSLTRCNDGYIISKDLIPTNYKLK